MLMSTNTNGRLRSADWFGRNDKLGLIHRSCMKADEIGVRIALGATAGDIRAMVLRQAGVWTLAGLALGLGCAAACTRFIEGLLYEVKPATPLPLAGAVFLLTLTALMAAWLPALRASRITPVEALREL